MKVLFDHQIFSIQKYGGASRYFCELLRNLPQGTWGTSARYSVNEYVKHYNLFPTKDLIPGVDFWRKPFFRNNLNKPLSLKKILEGNYDVFHQTHFETYCLKALGNKKMVTTFHDMNHVKYADLYTYNLVKGRHWMEGVQKKSVERADQIIAISQSTKNDLIDYFGTDERKITVIHHGVSKSKLPLSTERLIAQDYILFVGERDGFKNFKRFIEAFSMLTSNYKGMHLVCTGRSFTVEEFELFRALGIKDKVHQLSASEVEMAKLYRDAAMLVFPSLSEGFGMPILEAMVYDCPVVLSQSSSFPEIAGDAGLYFDPLEKEDMSNKMIQLLDSSEVRNKLISAGQLRLDSFSWEKCAKEHFEVYQSLV